MVASESPPIRSEVLRTRELLRDLVCPILIILFTATQPCPALAAPGRTAADPQAPAELQSNPEAQRPNDLFGIRGDIAGLHDRGFRSGTMETLWIFDADFEDLTGDNAGWTSLDMSGTLEQVNYWHKDTIRTGGFPHLGDSTWWCGFYSNCWDQPRGYGNEWLCYLSRAFPLSAWSDLGDNVMFEWDQRFAIENNYDYGYVDMLPDGDSEWVTLATFDNPGFAGAPGTSTDWDHEAYGHWSLDLSAYAGTDVTVRFRLESDGANSSQDMPDSSPMHPFRDGAWQLDNFELAVNDTVRWFDDCESPGNNGWAHEDIPTTGQTGVVFRRTYCPETLRSFSCDSWLTGWWMAALDSVTGRTVEGQASWLVSPPIDIAGADHLIGEWTYWKDCPNESHDYYNYLLASSNAEECVRDLDEFEDLGLLWWEGTELATRTGDWDDFAGKDWMAITWRLRDYFPGTPGSHWTGFMLDRQRVGVPVGEPGTTWDYSVWLRFNDRFVEQMAESLEDSAIIDVRDDDDILSVALVATNGTTTTSYPCRRIHPYGNDWSAPPPTTEIVPGVEIRYYFEAADGVGNISTYPRTAPEAYYEFSILPIAGSVADPAVLLVDKHGRTTPGEDRRYRHTSERYFREALDILGFEYDVYDVEVPSGSIKSEGPDTCGMKYYDTQIWFTNEFDSYTILRSDQRNLIDWLSEASAGSERNLLLTGNDIGKELIEDGDDTLGFYTDWLAVQYLDDSIGDVTVDSLPGLRDFVGGFDFMRCDDRQCVLRGGCPELGYFDVIQPYPGIDGAELVAEYVKADLAPRPAGVAYTDTSGYQTVTLGFGMEFMSDVLLPNGHYASGASDRVDLVANIMEYFEKAPTGPGTGTPDGSTFANRLTHARPNPFNPATTIAYSVAAPGRVILRVYDLAGREVRTLVDRDVEPGEHRVLWDGTTDAGHRAASGVYFVKMDIAGHTGAFRATRKLVLLK